MGRSNGGGGLVGCAASPMLLRSSGLIIIFIMKNIMSGHANANNKKVTVEDFTPTIATNANAATIPTKQIVIWFRFTVCLLDVRPFPDCRVETSTAIEPIGPSGSGLPEARLEWRGIGPTRLSS